MNKFRLSTLCLSFIAVPFLLNPTTVFAKHPDYSMLDYAYDNGYDDGYEDGYDDAMEDCPCPPGIKALTSGFYLGASAGYEGFQIERKPWIEDDSIGSLNTHANGASGRLFGGYGHYFNRYYLGGEVFVGTSGANGKDSINTPGLEYNGKVSVGMSYGLSVLPGYKITEAGPLLYGRAGYIQTELKATDTSGVTGGSSTNWTSGYNLGIGVEVPIYQKLSARLEYDYMNYSSFKNKGITGSNNSPIDTRGSIDLIYNFPY